LEPVETALGDAIGLIDVRKMSTGLELLNSVLEDESRCFLLRFPEDPVVGSPDHMERLDRERCSTP